jgi:PIN domain nuclease of toxin-antitoxin system
VTILLDTHAFLWFFTGDSRLSTTARAAIESETNDNLLSTAALWEIAIKTSLGKLTFSGGFEEVMLRAISDLSLSILPITLPHLVRLAELPFHHRDPFDRLVASQALVEQIPIVSADDIFDAYGVARLW